MTTYFGEYGGAFVPDTFWLPLDELKRAFFKFCNDDQAMSTLSSYLCDYVGRPSSLFFAKTLSSELGSSIWLKREDLNHTGSHKINNTLGQVMLAKYMGKTHIIAETGAGQHGVATATACSLLGMSCVIYMGKKDMDRQALNVHRMKLLGAEVRPVFQGSQTLKEAVTMAMRDWMQHFEKAHYVIGSVLGPAPFPLIVRHFQSIIGKELKKQLSVKIGRDYPDLIIACVGGGSNAMGIFYPFIEDKRVDLLCVESAGKGLNPGSHAASLSRGEVGIFHGSKTYILQNKYGQISPVHSIAAGLDYPGVSPELSSLYSEGRIKVKTALDTEAIDALQWLSQKEGIIPALETAHAFSVLKRLKHKSDKVIVVNVSGRGDKDMEAIAKGA